MDFSLKTTHGIFFGFCETSKQARLDGVRMFLFVFFVTVSRVELKVNFYWVELTYAHYVCVTSSCLHFFGNFWKIAVLTTITRTREHSIIKHAHTSLTLTKNEKNIAYKSKYFRRIWDLGTRAFNKKNPDPLWLSLFGHDFESKTSSYL